MVEVLAVGVPGWPQASAGFDWKPLLLVLIAVLLVRSLVGLPITWITAAVAFVAGTLWAWLIDAWGVMPPTAVAMILAVAAASVADRSGA